MFNLSKVFLMSHVRIVKVMLLVSILSGCGFQLRGSLDISETISPLYLESNSVFALGRELKLLLATNNILVTNKVTQSNSQVTLISEDRKRRVLTVDGDGRAREYLLMYTVNFSIKIKDGAQEVVDDSISLTRSLLFNTEAVLAVTNESEILYKDMQRNAARLILLRLQARARNDLGAENNSSKDAAGSKSQ